MSKNKIHTVIIAVLCIALATTLYFLFRDEESQVVARVGTHKITLADLDDELIHQYGEELLNTMVNREVVYQTAEALGIQVTKQEIMREIDELKEGFNSDEEFLASIGSTMEELQEDIRFNLLLEEIATKDVFITEAEVESYYQNNIEQYTEPESVYLHQIIVASLEEAEQIIQELKQGADFAALAREQSLDHISSGQGGEIGWITNDDPSIEESVIQAAFSIDIGKISSPVPVTEGFAVVKITDRKDKRVIPFEEVKEEIRKEIALSQVPPISEILEQLKRDKRVEVNKDLLHVND
jgi:foldase protein PrsA